MPVPLLLADWLQALGPLIGVVFWVVYQVLVAIREEKDAKEKPAERPLPNALDEAPLELEGQAAAMPTAPAEAQAAGQAEVRTEVEEFLRRIGQEPEKVAAGPAPPEKKPPLDPFEEPPVRRKPKRRRKPRQATARVEVVVDEGTGEKQASVGTPVRLKPSPMGRLNEERLSEHASHLGEEIAHADDRIEARLHKKFDHQLGSLSRREAVKDAVQPTDESQPSAAARVKQILSTPDGVRDAILLREIFSRPTDRW